MTHPCGNVNGGLVKQALKLGTDEFLHLEMRIVVIDYKCYI